jgi:hypothetical protein
LRLRASRSDFDPKRVYDDKRVSQLKPGMGVVKSLEHIGSGPVGLIHTQKIEIKYKKPLRDTWQKKDFPRR